ncbi:MAG: hypothetical protein HFJ12_00370 [Bacilli bacterium]|nr:hypothetical protein [Bacilli bacterium]
MSDEKTLEIVNKIFKNVFGRENHNSLDEILEKFAFDIKLPKKVRDSVTNEITWADSINSGKYITLENMQAKDQKDGWMVEKREVNNLEDLVRIWNSINLTTTERVYDSENVAKSDTIYGCENVYRSTDCRGSKNMIFCDSCGSSEFLLASQRSGSSSFCIRTDDSKDCSNSYNVVCSNKIMNSFFIQDCFDLYECIFCSHIASKKYCIANMQFEEEEYFLIKNSIIDWILNS